MKNGKSRTRFAFIRVLDQQGQVVERFSIDSRGKPILQTKTEDLKSIKDIQVIKPGAKLPQLKPVAPVGIEPILPFDSDSLNHWANEEDLIIRDYEQFPADLSFDFETDLALRSAIELLPDPFFL